MTLRAISCANEAETGKLAAELAETCAPGDILLLEGDLGAGKTAFSRAFIRHLTNDPNLEVPSPTFTLLQTYTTPKGEVWHFDLYRLKDPDEIFDLGWEDACAGGIVLVEWPERLGEHCPKKALELYLGLVRNQPQARDITITDKRQPDHA